MNCPNCQEQINETSKFCGFCGCEIEKSVDQKSISQNKLNSTFIENAKTQGSTITFLKRNISLLIIGLISITILVFLFMHLSNKPSRDDIVGLYIDGEESYRFYFEDNLFYLDFDSELFNVHNKRLVVDLTRTGKRWEGEAWNGSDLMWDFRFQYDKNNIIFIDVTCNLWDGNRKKVYKSN